MAVPAEVEKRVGQTTLVTINQMLAPSQLRYADKKRAEAQLERLIKASNVASKPELIFRSMGGKFPNAFALPGGYIVVSDELINLPVTDDELAAVLAHEMGHWQRRHGLQGLLRGSTALLVVSAVTGDLSTLSTFAGSIPFVILQRGYSREFESEADIFAIELLQRAKIDLGNFESVLEKLESTRPSSGTDYTYLSTHPSNAERIHRINPTGVRRSPAMKLANVQTAGGPETVPTSAIPGVIDSELLDTRPRLQRPVQPYYPAELARQNITGNVNVEFVIDANGDTRDWKVLSSSDRRFEATALAAVAQWKFMPGTFHGENVAVRATQLIEFNLDETPPPKKTIEQPAEDKSSSEVPPVIPLE